MSNRPVNGDRGCENNVGVRTLDVDRCALDRKRYQGFDRGPRTCGQYGASFMALVAMRDPRGGQALAGSSSLSFAVEHVCCYGCWSYRGLPERRSSQEETLVTTESPARRWGMGCPLAPVCPHAAWAHRLRTDPERLDPECFSCRRRPRRRQPLHPQPLEREPWGCRCPGAAARCSELASDQAASVDEVHR